MAAESPGNLVYTWLDWAHLDDDARPAGQLLWRAAEYDTIPGSSCSFQGCGNAWLH